MQASEPDFTTKKLTETPLSLNTRGSFSFDLGYLLPKFHKKPPFVLTPSRGYGCYQRNLGK